MSAAGQFGQAIPLTRPSWLASPAGKVRSLGKMLLLPLVNTLCSPPAAVRAPGAAPGASPASPGLSAAPQWSPGLFRVEGRQRGGTGVYLVAAGSLLRGTPVRLLAGAQRWDAIWIGPRMQGAAATKPVFPSQSPPSSHFQSCFTQLFASAVGKL